MSEQWIHSGWMSKEGHLNPLWKSRFFVLSGDTLTYYNDETMASRHEFSLWIAFPYVSL